MSSPLPVTTQPPLIFKPSSQAHIESCAKDIYSSVGLRSEIDYTLYNVPLKTIDGFIHTLEGGFHNKRKLLMVHGYGAASVLWFKMLPSLIQKFHVYSIDLYGMGSSYKFKFGKKSADEAIDLYTKSIEEWRTQ
jgi:pimeloyl-ACP methyl ester carboxylesterase